MSESEYEVESSEAAYTEAENRIERAIKDPQTELDLSLLGLKELPQSLSRVRGIRDLFLEGNKLTYLPQWFSQLNYLGGIRLDVNQLTEFPDVLRGFDKLRVLWINSNRMRALPEWIGQLTELSALRLDDNLLTSLPESLRALNCSLSLCEAITHSDCRLSFWRRKRSPQKYSTSTFARAEARVPSTKPN